MKEGYMCGLVGFFSEDKNKGHMKIIYKLFKESKIRGLHSFGFSYYHNNRIVTIKSFIFPSYHILKDFYYSDDSKIILHNRYSTSGSWLDMNNNQPITINTNLSVVMNGIISMKEKKGFEEEFKIKCICNNDTEIFARKVESGEDIEKFVRKIAGSIACIFLFKGNIYAIRNNKRPLHCFKLDNAIFVCSTVDMVYRAIGDIKTYSLKPGKLFNLRKLLKRL